MSVSTTLFGTRIFYCSLVTDTFNGPGRSLAQVCMLVYVRTITFEWNDLWCRYLSCRFSSTLSRSRLSGQSSRSQDEMIFFQQWMHTMRWDMLSVAKSRPWIWNWN